jgi:hypothetical protein
VTILTLAAKDVEAGDVLVDSIHGQQNEVDSLTIHEVAVTPLGVVWETSFGRLRPDNHRSFLVDRDVPDA